MPETTQIPLQAARVPVDVQFCDFKTPQDLIDFVVENASGDGSSISSLFTNQLIFSPNEPVGTDKGKVWIKNVGTDRGIYLLIDGKYQGILLTEETEEEPPVPEGGIIMYSRTTVPAGWNTYTGSGMPELPSGLMYIIRQ